MNGKSIDDLMSVLYNVQEHIKDLNITEIMENQGQSLLSFFPIDKLMCKFLFFILDKTNSLNIYYFKAITKMLFYVSDESIYKDIVAVNCLVIINDVKKTISSYLQQNLL
jgi:hypothetical protein